MTIAVNFVNTERNEAIENFVAGLVTRTFQDIASITDVAINFELQIDPRVPWKCLIQVKESAENLVVESQAGNYLTSFAQALSRIKRNLEKMRNLRA